MQATARMLPVMYSKSFARRRLMRSVRRFQMRADLLHMLQHFIRVDPVAPLPLVTQEVGIDGERCPQFSVSVLVVDVLRDVVDDSMRVLNLRVSPTPNKGVAAKLLCIGGFLHGFPFAGWTLSFGGVKSQSHHWV